MKPQNAASEICASKEPALVRVLDVRDAADQHRFAAEVRGAGFRRVILLGMGGSSLAPDVYARLAGGGPAGLAAAVYGGSEGLRTILVERYATLSARDLVHVATCLEAFYGLSVGYIAALYIEARGMSRHKVRAARRFLTGHWG